jgi:hypothetical protein
MGSIVRSSSENFDQWAFAIGRRRRVPHGKTDMLSAPLSGPGTFFAGQCWADYTISMSGFELRQAQGRGDPAIGADAHGHGIHNPRAAATGVALSETVGEARSNSGVVSAVEKLT